MFAQVSLISALACFLTLMAMPAKADPAKPPCGDDSRECLASIATAYSAALLSHDGSALPLAPHVRRTENGLINAQGENEVRASFNDTKMVRDRRNLRLVVDEQQHEVVAFYLLDVALTGPARTEVKAGDKRYKVAVSVPSGEYTVHEAERFKIQQGQIQDIEIISYVEKGKGGASGWPD
jgi:hypothetical protein